ncbi:MAG TPA: M61 family peptidase [Acidobacteriaceae bacterium]|nr:M61 family peptidase [Acidobacteriaceae bacterium]
MPASIPGHFAWLSCFAVCFLNLFPCQAHAQAGTQHSPTPILLHVDLRDAPRHLLHVHLVIPVSPGPLTLEYPQWIPGDHRPTGPIDNVAGVFIRANGHDLPWRRDDVDMYGIHVDVPAGVGNLDVSFDFLAVPGQTGSDEDQATSENIAVLEWNSVVMYPAHVPVAAIPITASLTLPSGWKFGTALTVERQAGADASFASTSVEQLVDSPLIAGRYFREIRLAPDVTPKHFLDVAGEAPEDLELKPAFLNSISQLVRETGVLYGSRHYETYHFLLSLSDRVREEGLEHHQSSDNGVQEHGFSDEKLALLNADLLTHEFTHSWNGKYRRPAGLATPDYATPMRDDLLWVYEGMTQYWGTVLAAHTGLWTDEQYREALALTAARMDNRTGRLWRNVQDTAIGAQFLRGRTQGWINWRRGQDYYQEGQLIWLDVDTTIRSLTHNRHSLNDFCTKFLAVGGNTPPKVVPYDFDEIVTDLNAVTPYDWRGFLMERLTSHAAHAPLGGIERGGYRLVYGDQPTEFESASLNLTGQVDAFFSAGIQVGRDGAVADVRMESPAFEAGFGPGARIIAVDGHGYTPEVLRRAIRDSKGSTTPIEFIVSNDNEFRVLRLNYHGGERYPRLERIEGSPALLDDILRPLIPPGTAAKP